jgi:hypothetical protein
LGWRLQPAKTASAYIGLAANTEGHIVTLIDTPVSELNRVNEGDGFTGKAGSARARLNTGLSAVAGQNLLTLVSFAQLELNSKQANTPATTFNGTGARVQYDSTGLTLGGEGFIEWRSEDNKALGTNTKYTRWGVAANAVKRFGSHWMVGASGSYSRDSAQVGPIDAGMDASKANSNDTFNTASPLVGTATLEVGYQP